MTNTSLFFLVDKFSGAIKETVKLMEEGNHTKDEIQKALDQMTVRINELREEFDENESDIEMVARDSIGVTVENILTYFNVDIDIKDAIRERDW